MKVRIEYYKWDGDWNAPFEPEESPHPRAYKATYLIQEWYSEKEIYQYKAMLRDNGEPYIGIVRLPDENIVKWLEKGCNHKVLPDGSHYREVEVEGWFVDLTDFDEFYRLYQDRGGNLEEYFNTIEEIPVLQIKPPETTMLSANSAIVTCE